MRFCIQLVLVSLLALVGAEQAPSTQPAKPDSKTLAAFENLKALAGQWEGQSTKGWTEVLDIDVIAAGTCVLETSRFAHGDGDGMATMFHLDGPHLMLTHYCMAKNQPRLRAAEISDDGKQILFTFLDGTNLASRDVGHMDKVKIQFQDSDHFRSQWTFYANGQEKWMEEIVCTRVQPQQK